MAIIKTSEVREKIITQMALAEKIKLLQAEEREVRAEILSDLFGEDNLGTRKTEAGGFMITGTYGQTYSFVQDEIGDAIEQGLLSEDAEVAVRVKFEVDKKAYDKLSDEAAAELDDYITVKPSLPSIKIVPIAEDEE